MIISKNQYMVYMILKAQEDYVIMLFSYVVFERETLHVVNQLHWHNYNIPQ